MDRLPIDGLLPDIVAALRATGAVVVEAAPGAGKTTRVPRALLDAGFAAAGEILVLQPRRLPARLGATRVAAELGETPGGQVGYTVRFEDVSGPRTRIRFVTEGILNRRLLTDPELSGVSVVVLDEFHERHLASDVALALLRRLQLTRRPDLKLCVMSATLDADPLVEYLDGCPRARSDGRRFDVDIEYLPQPQPDDRPLAVQVTAAVRSVLRRAPDGDVLVFLPGNAEIRRCEEALTPVAQSLNLLMLPLHGDLPLPAQARVVAPSSRRKLILSTNVAETSVTIDGVVAVVDSGLARIAGHSPWTGLPNLALAKISQASAVQRAGRAGRTRAGVALRLYTRADFEARRIHDVPEIERSDLTEVVLGLHAWGITDPDAFDWLTPPPAGAVRAATELLRRLGALDAAEKLTERGHRMLRFPAHPRLARLLTEGEDRGVGPDAATLAALIAERDIRERGGPHSARRGGGRDLAGGGIPPGPEGVDVIALLELFEQARAARFSSDRVRLLGLDARATAVAEQARRQFASLMAPVKQHPTAAPLSRRAMDQALCRAALAGFSDRVARRREGPGTRTVVLAAGGTAALAYEPDSDFLVALDAEERTGASAGRPGAGPGRIASGAGGRGATTVIRMGCGIEADWLGELDGDDLRAVDAVEFDAGTERVVQRSRLMFRALVLDESVRPAEPGAEVSHILAEAALARGAAAFAEPGELAALLARLTTLAQMQMQMDDDSAVPIPKLDDAGLRDALIAACDGMRSFAELRERGLTQHLMDNFEPRLRARLIADTPLTLKLPGGRAVRVNYQPDQPPWIESRLQDFFGMAKGPALARGRIPLTLRLLAPNGRPVQVTSDLESFWRQHYPALRRELGRRYPRHPWPEDGRTATPPPPLPPRRRS